MRTCCESLGVAIVVVPSLLLSISLTSGNLALPKLHQSYATEYRQVRCTPSRFCCHEVTKNAFSRASFAR